MPVFYIPPRLACWGDSLTVGLAPAFAHVTDGQWLPENYGVGGETSTQIRTRLEAASATTKGLASIIWAGRNDFQTPSTVVTNIAAMVAALTGDYLVLSVPNGEHASEYRGGTDYANIATINASLSATYGTHYFDVREFLIARPSATAQDAIDVRHDIVPASYRTDAVHLTTAGYRALAMELASVISARFAPLTGAAIDLPLYPVSASPANKLGVGTLAPLTLLHVDADSNYGAVVVSNATKSANPFLAIGIAGASDAIITGAALGDACVLTNPLGRLRISANNGGRTDLAIRNADGGLELLNAIDMATISTPSAPLAGVRLYADVSNGKTRLMALFPSGAAQVVKSEP